MPTARLVPKFQIIFDIYNETLTFIDQSTNRSATTQGTFRITHVDSATILYTGSGWHATTPTWSTPPIDGSTSTWQIASIPIPTSYNGVYRVEYWTRVSGSHASTLTTRSFTLAYTAPTVELETTISCSTSELTGTDDTDYGIVHGASEFAPTMSRVQTFVKPAGSGYTGTLSWTDAGSISERTIGGGSTSATRLWTKIWQYQVVSTLSYTLSAWSASTMAVTLTDTVSGETSADVKCSSLLCALAQCYTNLLSRWVLSLTSNFDYRDNKRDTVVQAGSLFIKLLWAEKCGTVTDDILEEIDTLLAGENCVCSTSSSAASEPVVPWSALTGSGATVSDFNFYIETTNPTSDLIGVNGDLWLNGTTGDIFKKVGGTWGSAVANIKGIAGDAGSDTGALTVLLHDTTDRSTPASTAATQISYDFQINNSQFENANDYMTFEWPIKFAKNQNGKEVIVNFAGAEIASYFADDLVNDDTDRLVVKLRVTPINSVNQHLMVMFERSGKPGETVGPIFERNHGVDLNTTRSVSVYGKNSVAAASDILCDETIVKRYYRDTTLVPATTPLSSGRGLVSQTFIATAGQTDFTVTDFEPNDYYIPLIDNVVQSQLVVTRSGYVFTYSPGLSAGQILTIVD